MLAEAAVTPESPDGLLCQPADGGYVSRKEHVLVNMRLYLPEEWAQDRDRRKAAGVPKAVKFRTRQELALEMLDECGARLPHAWVAGDDEMGRPSGFRQQLRT